jgi:hypothetical protein
VRDQVTATLEEEAGVASRGLEWRKPTKTTKLACKILRSDSNIVQRDDKLSVFTTVSSSWNVTVPQCSLFENNFRVFLRWNFFTNLYELRTHTSIHLVIIALKYTSKSVGEKGTPWHNSLPISVSFYNWKLSFINILYCEFMSNIAFKNVSETVPVFKLSNEVSFVHDQTLFRNLQNTIFFFQMISTSFFN